MANYSFTDPGDAIPDGSVIESGNFTQLVPGTAIMVGKNLVINGGNFTNVAVQPEWTVNGGNWTQVDWCSHLNPNLIAMGFSSCVDECRHMTDKHEIWLDGILIDTIYEYENKRVV